MLLARSLPSFSSLLLFAGAAQIFSWLLITTGFHAYGVTYRTWQYYWLAVRIGLPALTFAGFLVQTRDRSIPNVWFRRVMELFALYAIGWSFMLLFDGYYRDIPELDFCLPVGGLIVLAALDRSVGGLLPRSRLIGWGLVAAGLASAFSEVWALHIARDFVAAHPTLAEQLPYLIKRSKSVV